jgi:NDP-sugar pyrophosphorylase family protein
MKAMPDSQNIDVVILCGGKGTRLQPVISDRPKPMAEMKDRPFLDILIDYLCSYGFRRYVLCVGYMKESIKEYFTRESRSEKIIFSDEETLLGTGGALKNGELLIHSDPFLVLNGDSFCPLDYRDFLSYYFSKGADVSIALDGKSVRKDYGVVTINDKARITSFSEKTDKKDEYVNAGVYIFNQTIFSLIPHNKVISLENDLFPYIIDRKVFGYVTKNTFIDIGTPERYEKAAEFINKFVDEGLNG